MNHEAQPLAHAFDYINLFILTILTALPLLAEGYGFMVGHPYFIGWRIKTTLDIFGKDSEWGTGLRKDVLCYKMIQHLIYEIALRAGRN